MSKVLVVEDDLALSAGLCFELDMSGYLTVAAYTGKKARQLLLTDPFDLVLLDLMLPGISGEELVSLFSKTVPVIVLSAKSGLDSKVDVLSAGAEDYICKPFDLPELLVRIQIRLRSRNRDRNGTEAGAAAAEQRKKASGKEGAEYERHAYTYRDWTLNPDTWEMTADGQLVELTRHEFLIMELLIRNPRRVFTKQMIYEYAWGEEYLAEDKTINVHISNIRSKLKKSGTDSYIQTVWGMGFKLS